MLQFVAWSNSGGNLLKSTEHDCACFAVVTLVYTPSHSTSALLKTHRVARWYLNIFLVAKVIDISRTASL